MNPRFLLVVAGTLVILVTWLGQAAASCQQCPEGQVCYIPEDLGWNFGYCVELPTEDADEATEDNEVCFCQNDGRYHQDIILFSCPCIAWWAADQEESDTGETEESLARGTSHPAPDILTELPEESEETS